MLELKNVTKIYKTKAGDTAALNNFSVTLPDSGLVFITGKSGSGKTTLLNVVGALDGFDSGDIVIDGKSFSQFSAHDYSSYRNTFVGFVFQEYNLLPSYTVEKNIKIANELQGKETTKEQVDELLKLVDLEGLNNRKPSQLSGGQKQRVAIARALVKNPKLIMADEPTGALDQATGIQVMETLKKLSKDNLVVVVSHDLEIAEKFADRILRLVDGQLVEDVSLTDKEISSNLLVDEQSVTVKNGSELNQNETAELVKAIREKRKINFVDSLSVRSKSPTQPIEAVHPEKPVAFVSSKMKLKSSMGLGVNSLKAKPFRLIITIILSVFAFAMFGIFDTVGAYDDTRAIANLLKTGGYNAITASAQYSYEGKASDVKITQKQIDEINRSSGYKFRALYELYDGSNKGINTGCSLDGIRLQTSKGSKYYYTTLTDFIEFGKNEMTDKGTIGSVIDKNGFNLKVLHGTYPTIKPLADGEFYTDEYFSNIAISSYTAKVIQQCINEANGTIQLPSGLSKIDKLSQLIGQQIELTNFSGIPYTIRAIIDCGEVPAKYDELKTSISSKTSTLEKDLITFLNAGLFFKIFVPQGYVDAWIDYTNRSVRCYTNTNNAHFTLDKMPLGDNAGSDYQTMFYNSSMFSLDNAIFFDESRSSSLSLGTAKVTKDGKEVVAQEVIINVNDFIKYYSKECNQSSVDKKDRDDLLASIRSTNETPELRRSSLNQLLSMVGASSSGKTLTLIRKDVYTGQTKEYTVKIVGVYFGLNQDIYRYTSSGIDISFPLMLSPSFLNKLGVYANQGYYPRLVAPMNTGYFATNNLAKQFVNENGLKLSWFNNTILGDIENNRQSLEQFSNLFLYFALILAAFSIFMLYNYISTSIVSRKQSIGVLRCLGSNSRDIFRIFITESLIIALINGVLACAVAYVGCIFVNMYIQTVMGFTISFAIYSVRQVIITMIASIVTGVLASLIPIIKICKEKPVDLVRRPD